MKPTLRLTALFCWSAVLGLAGSWSGNLVDSKCYASEERNVNPTDTFSQQENEVLHACAARRQFQFGSRRKCQGR
jgi:hypothetical protein